MGNYIFWEKWRREIFIDLDGSLTKPIAQSLNLTSQLSGSISPYRSSLMMPNHCYNITSKWDNSVYCDQTVTMRGILFSNAIPKIDFNAIDIKIRLLENPYTNLTTSNLFEKDFGIEEMIVIKPLSMDIPFSWAMPFATNKYYNVHWKWGIDFTHLAIAPSRLWSVTDGLVLRFNYTDNR